VWVDRSFGPSSGCKVLLASLLSLQGGDFAQGGEKRSAVAAMQGQWIAVSRSGR
jgi:hypothetical protein